MPRLGLVSSLTGGAVLEGFVNASSISLDGTNDYVDVGDLSGLETNGDLSFSFWAKPGSVTGAQGLINVYTNFPSNSMGEFYVSFSGTTVQYWMNNEKWKKLGTGLTIATGNWYHIVATYRDIDNESSASDAGTASRLYINATEYDAGAGTGTFPASGAISGSGLKTVIGGFYNASYTVQGIMDEVATFSKVLSSGDVSDIYNSGTPTDISEMDGLTGYWRFEEGSGTEVADSSTNSNAGTLTNSPTWSTDVPS